MKSFTCFECGAENNTELIEVDRTLPVRGEPIAFKAAVRRCLECGERVFDSELADETLAKAYEIYRHKHGLLGPLEIRELRERYGLTQRGLSDLLGLGEIMIHRYESGSLPDEAHNLLLRLVLSIDTQSFLRR